MLFIFGFVAIFVGMDIAPEESLTASRHQVGAQPWRTPSSSRSCSCGRSTSAPCTAAFAGPTRSRHFGTALSLVGLVLLVAGVLAPRRHRPARRPLPRSQRNSQDQATLVLVWTGIDAVFDALLYSGLVMLPLGLLGFGAAMRRQPGYGSGIGRSTVALGLAGLAAAAAVLLGVPDMAAVGMFALIGFHLSVGRKTLKLAKAPQLAGPPQGMAPRWPLVGSPA